MFCVESDPTCNGGLAQIGALKYVRRTLAAGTYSTLASGQEERKDSKELASDEENVVTR